MTDKDKKTLKSKCLRCFNCIPKRTALEESKYYCKLLDTSADNIKKCPFDNDDIYIII